MPKTLPLGAFYGLAFLITLLDQLTKALIIQKLPEGDSYPLARGIFHLTHVRNDGIAFSMLRGQQWLIILASVVIMGGIIYTVQRATPKLERLYGLALALPLGGALGNLIDRVRFGLVTDFLDFRLINFAVFNLADSAITIGIVLLFLRGFFASNPVTKEADNATDSI
jgi:signal peptidase II